MNRYKLITKTEGLDFGKGQMTFTALMTLIANEVNVPSNWLVSKSTQPGGGYCAQSVYNLHGQGWEPTRIFQYLRYQKAQVKG